MEIALYQEEAELLHVDKQTKPLEVQARQLYMHVYQDRALLSPYTLLRVICMHF